MKREDQIFTHSQKTYMGFIELFKKTFRDEIITLNRLYQEEINNQPGFFARLKTKAERKLFTEVATTVVEKTAQNVGELADHATIGKSVADLAGGVIRASSILYFHLKDKKAKEHLNEAKKFVDNLKKIGGKEFLDDAVDYLTERFFFALQELWDKKHSPDIEELALFFTGSLCELLLGNIPQNQPKEWILMQLVPSVDSNLFKHALILNKKLSYQGWTIEGLIHRAPACTPEGEYYVKPTQDARQDKYSFQCIEKIIAEKSHQLGRMHLTGEFIQREDLLNQIPTSGNVKEWKSACKKYHKEIVLESKSWKKFLEDMEVTSKKQRKLREKLWQKLIELKNCPQLDKRTKYLQELREIMTNYTRCLWITTYHEFITQKRPINRVWALWLQQEVAWLALLFAEGRLSWKQNTSIAHMRERIKHLGVLAQFVLALPITLNLQKNNFAPLTVKTSSSSPVGGFFSKSKDLNNIYASAYKLYEGGRRATTQTFAKSFFENAIKLLHPLISQLDPLINQQGFTHEEKQQKELAADAHHLIGMCYFGLQDHEQALKAIKMTLQLRPQDREALYAEIRLLDLMEEAAPKLIAAINSFKAYYPDDPKNPQLLEIEKRVQTGQTIIVAAKP